MSAYRINAEDPDERTRLVRRNRALERWFRIFRASLWPVRAWKHLRAWYAKQQIQLRTPALPSTLPAPVPPPPPRLPKIVFSRYYNRAIDSTVVDGAPVFTVVMPEGHVPESFTVQQGDIDEVVVLLWDVKPPLVVMRRGSSGFPLEFLDYKYPWYDIRTGQRIEDNETQRHIQYAVEMRCRMCRTEEAAALREWRAKRVQDYHAAGMYF